MMWGTLRDRWYPPAQNVARIGVSSGVELFDVLATLGADVVLPVHGPDDLSTPTSRTLVGHRAAR